MRYDSLHELIKHSSSSRRYFLSLTVSMQLALHERGEYIHTAQEIRVHVDAIKQQKRLFGEPNRTGTLF